MSISTATTPQKSQDVQAAHGRLNQLERYLISDPGNSMLLLDAFDTALAARQWDRAEFHLRHGQALGSFPVRWQVRAVDFHLAQQKLGSARDALAAVQTVLGSDPELDDQLLFRKGWIDFQERDYRSCIEQFSSRMENSGQPTVTAPLQQLWLRALHQVGELSRAERWIVAAASSNTLQPSAAGVASLISFDLGAFSRAQSEVELCFRQVDRDAVPIEAYVTAASLALAQKEAPRCVELANEALRINSKDGRALSALAFSKLLSGDLAAAMQAFQVALAEMPKHIGTWQGLAWTCVLLKDLDEAQRSFDAALDLDRNFAESHGGLAVVYALKLDREMATICLSKAIGLDPDNMPAQFAKAVLDGRVSDADSIRRLFDHLMIKRRLHKR
jgi:tetratricopeptide (TPR) repeat protein